MNLLHSVPMREEGRDSVSHVVQSQTWRVRCATVMAARRQCDHTYLWVWHARKSHFCCFNQSGESTGGRLFDSFHHLQSLLYLFSRWGKVNAWFRPSLPCGQERSLFILHGWGCRGRQAELGVWGPSGSDHPPTPPSYYNNTTTSQPLLCLFLLSSGRKTVITIKNAVISFGQKRFEEVDYS